MKRALVPLAEGFEEIEAVTIIDVLRRAGIEVVTAALGDLEVMGAHGIALGSDRRLDDIRGEDFDAIVLPGGGPGAKRLQQDARILSLLREQRAAGRLIAAICAAPAALEAAGVIEGRRATAYPGTRLASAQFSEDRVVVDRGLVTSRGPGTALEFALTLVVQLGHSEAAAKLRQDMLVQAVDVPSTEQQPSDR